MDDGSVTDDVIVEQKLDATTETMGEIVVTAFTPQPTRVTSSASSSTLTPAPDILIVPTRRTPVYNDIVPSDSKFWVEINRPSLSDFNRDLYDIDEDEFNVVGIYDEIGEGAEKAYEAQFEDGHMAMVTLTSNPLTMLDPFRETVEL